MNKLTALQTIIDGMDINIIMDLLGCGSDDATQIRDDAMSNNMAPGLIADTLNDLTGGMSQFDLANWIGSSSDADSLDTALQILNVANA